jgi:GNAT superfamily N-acetyltransferase
MTEKINRADLIIRAPGEADEQAWRQLWAGYCAFYGTALPEEVTRETWRRILQRGNSMFCRIAAASGVVAGFAISVVHPGSWTVAPVCYLEDLFVAPGARGQGIGRALIEDVIALGKASGWSRLYWHTREGNQTARRLYDRFAQADDFVRYRVLLT